MVGVRGFEPPGTASRKQCSTRLSYTPPPGRHIQGEPPNGATGALYWPRDPIPPRGRTCSGHPRLHPAATSTEKTWMPGTSPGKGNNFRAGWASEPAFGGEAGCFGKGMAQRSRREWRQRLDRRGGVDAGPRQGLDQGAAAFDQPQGAFEIARALLALFQGAPPEGALLAVAAREGDQDRQGDFAVAEIVTDGFAELARARREIEHVINQLIGNAEVAAKPGERLLLIDRALGEDGADPARRRK